MILADIGSARDGEGVAGRRNAHVELCATPIHVIGGSTRISRRGNGHGVVAKDIATDGHSARAQATGFRDVQGVAAGGLADEVRAISPTRGRGGKGRDHASDIERAAAFRHEARTSVAVFVEVKCAVTAKIQGSAARQRDLIAVCSSCERGTDRRRHSRVYRDQVFLVSTSEEKPRGPANGLDRAAGSKKDRAAGVREVLAATDGEVSAVHHQGVDRRRG